MNIKDEIVYMLVHEVLERLLKSNLISEEEYMTADRYSAEYLKAKIVIV